MKVFLYKSTKSRFSDMKKTAKSRKKKLNDIQKKLKECFCTETKNPIL